jgi:purine-binding chemotaxis protein CheW
MRNPTTKARQDPRKNLVGFVVGGVHYAIDIWRVREIVQPLALTPLPFTHPSIVGVADHRGEVVPVIDLRLQFGGSSESNRKTKWILIRALDRTMGIVVDAVTGPFGVADEQLHPPPALGGGEHRRGIAAVTTYQGRMVFVIGPTLIEEIIEPAMEQVLSAAQSPAQLGPA